MREVKLTKAASRQLSLYCISLYERDIETSVKSYTPGEWVSVLGDEGQKFIGFINPHVSIGPILRVIGKASLGSDPWEIITNLLDNAFLKRKKFSTYENYRLCYGDSDFLPGLLIDVFTNHVLVQINTAGLDSFRDKVKLYLEEKFIGKSIVLFDNEVYRRNEMLPQYENEELVGIEINENKFRYKVSGKTIQKVGYYFDHRENRVKLEGFLQNIPELDKGLDLFSYIGSWGLHMLRGGVREVDFVDQANMEENVNLNLSLNNLENRGKFIRKDVFSFLDQCVEDHNFFDIIVSDPPAFSKSEKNLKKALGGYEKLHYKSLRALNDEGYYIAASCTHGVSLEDLDSTVLKASKRVGKKVQLLDIGIQGWDHPFEGLKSRAHYIKYLLYQVYE